MSVSRRGDKLFKSRQQVEGCTEDIEIKAVAAFFLRIGEGCRFVWKEHREQPIFAQMFPAIITRIQALQRKFWIPFFCQPSGWILSEKKIRQNKSFFIKLQRVFVVILIRNLNCIIDFPQEVEDARYDVFPFVKEIIGNRYLNVTVVYLSEKGGILILLS